MRKTVFHEAKQRVHDYGHLLARWRRIARGAGMKLQTLANVNGFPICYLRSRGSLAGGFYVSAGIHGDEPAGPEALVQWAETHLAVLMGAKPSLPFFILPCLNPWGLVQNRRSDEAGRDLNRLFDRRVSPIREWRRAVGDERFALGVSLHEDYDARGVYLYEINDSPPDLGAALLRSCKSKAMPIESRRQIEDFPFKNGVLSRKIPLESVTIRPEALALYPRHTPHFITFETPSEFSLALRVRAHVRFLEACVRHLTRARACDLT